MDEKRVMTAADWMTRRKIRHETLPSGMVVDIVDSKLHAMTVLEILPMTLLARILETGDQKTMTPAEQAEMLNGMKKMMGMVRSIVVNPRISLEPEAPEGEISILNVPDEDIQFLMAFVLRKKEAEELAPFRSGANGDST
jgi:hypothetical protein